MVGKLSVHDLKFDDISYIGSKWYSFTSFQLGEDKTFLGIKYKTEIYALDELYLLSCSPRFIEKIPDPAVSSSDFEKRLELKVYDELFIREYIFKRMKEAEDCADIKEAFKCLEKYFSNNDE